MIGLPELEDSMNMIERLADDFRDWGSRKVRRVIALTKKHGVLCSAWKYSDGKRG
jgi:hypothetical protein